jgi:UDP-glucose 4-epimerase
VQVLVFGGAGFLGSHLVDLLYSTGHEVAIVDDLSRGKLDFIGVQSPVTIYRGDIRDPDLYARVLDNVTPEVVIHLAAVHHVPVCERQPLVALDVNVLGTQRVVDFCRDRNVARLVFASSGGVYDESIPGSLREEDLTKARDIRSASKLAGEALVCRGAERGWYSSSIARIFNLVGARDTHEHLVTQAIRQLREGNRRIEVGNLHPRRDFLHVMDAARAMQALCEVPSSLPTEIFNVGSGREWTVVEVLQQLADVAGVEVEIESVASKRREGDRLSLLAQISKIRDCCGWQPLQTLSDALVEAWNDHHLVEEEAA